MELTEAILAFSGTAVGGAIIGKWLNKKKDDLEVKLKEQVFYKTLIDDIEKQRKVEKDEIVKLKNEVKLLSNKITELLNSNREKDEIIQDQRKNVLRWEQNCERLESIIKQEQKKVSNLFKQIEEYEKQIKKNSKGN